jgi:endonuclease-3
MQAANGRESALGMHALQVHALLLDHYGEPARKPQRPPLDELVLTILSQNTSDLNSGRAWENLRARFGTWRDVAEADAAEVEEAIRVGGLAAVKAPRIQSIIRQLVQEQGEPTLDLLRDMSVEEAREYLTALPGVGPKTAACVLLFALHMPALPVDTHVHRLALRLGLAPAKTSAEKAHSLLEELLPEELYYPFHLLLIQHGRTLCKAQRPLCHLCPLTHICLYYAAQTAQADAPDA